jgi:hypothetical protein
MDSMTEDGMAMEDTGPPPDEIVIDDAAPTPVTEASHAASSDAAGTGISLLYDIELEATLQFGSRELMLREVLELAPAMSSNSTATSPSPSTSL